VTDFVKQHAALIVATILIWFSWSHLSEEGKKGSKEKARLVPIAASYLDIRPLDAAPFDLADPYRMAELFPEKASPDDAAEQEGDDEGGKGTGDEPPVIGTRAAGTARQSKGRVEVLSERPPPRPVSLWVDAVLAVPGAATARVCGRTVAVGEEIPGVDEEDPPRLLAVGDLSVEISYRGRSYSLSLDDEPLVVTAEAAPGAPLADQGGSEPAGGSP
jgi:hypothetical protein